MSADSNPRRARKIGWLTVVLAFVISTASGIAVIPLVWMNRLGYWHQLHPEATDGQIRFQSLVDGIEAGIFSWIAIFALILIAKWFYATNKLETRTETL